MKDLFADLQGAGGRLPGLSTAQATAACARNLRTIHIYWVYRVQKGRKGIALGPAWTNQRQKAKTKPWITRWREEQQHRMARAKDALATLTDALRRKISSTVKKVAEENGSSKGRSLLGGCEVARQVFQPSTWLGTELWVTLPSSNLFKPIEQETVSDDVLATEFSGPGAISFISGIFTRKLETHRRATQASR